MIMKINTSRTINLLIRLIKHLPKQRKKGLILIIPVAIFSGIAFSPAFTGLHTRSTVLPRVSPRYSRIPSPVFKAHFKIECYYGIAIKIPRPSRVYTRVPQCFPGVRKITGWYTAFRKFSPGSVELGLSVYTAI